MASKERKKDAVLQWESKLRLSATQRKAMDRIYAIVQEDRSARKRFQAGPNAASSPSPSRLPAAASSSSHSQSTLSTEAHERLQKKFTLEEHCNRSASSSASAYTEHFNRVKRFSDTLSRALSGLQEIEANTELLEHHHNTVSVKTTEVRAECQKLLQERKSMLESAQRLQEHLSYFEEVDHMKARLQRPIETLIHSAEFTTVFYRLEECFNFMKTHSDYKESAKYCALFRLLHLKILNAIKGHFLRCLQEAVAKVKANASVTSGGLSSVSSATAVVEFRTVASSLRVLLQDIEQRQKMKPYRTLLTQCLQIYAAQRDALLHSDIEAHLKQLSAQNSLPDLLQESCLYLVEICTIEYQLFKEFFDLSPTASEFLSDILSSQCSVLYTHARPLIIKELDLDVLCQVINIVQDVLEEQLGPRGDAVEAFAQVLRRIIGDVQERLTYRAEVFIRDEVASFQPTPAHLDYPSLLQPKEEKKNSATSPSSNGSVSSAAGRPTYRFWYPTLERTLLCLSKLYRCLEIDVFEALAFKAVTTCTHSLIDVSQRIQKQSGMIHGQLFLIQQLLILREQISPFKVDFAVTEHTLDLSHVTELIPALLRGGRQAWLSWSKMLDIVEQNEPKILDQRADSKKDMEMELKSVCENFINTQTRSLLGPLVDFLRKHDSTMANENGDNIAAQQTTTIVSAISPQQLPAVKEELNKVLQGYLGNSSSIGSSLKSRLHDLSQLMELYIRNQVTRNILFKPIKSNLCEVVQRLREFTERSFVPSDPAVNSSLLELESFAYSLD